MEEKCVLEEAREAFENDEKTVSRARCGSSVVMHCVIQHVCLVCFQMEFWAGYAGKCV